MQGKGKYHISVSEPHLWKDFSKWQGGKLLNSTFTSAKQSKAILQNGAFTFGEHKIYKQGESFEISKSEGE